MAEFKARFKGKEDVNIVETENCVRVSSKRKHFLEVSKIGNKWQAQTRHPKFKFHIYLGQFSTPEEAALVVKNRKAELEEMFKVEDGLRKKRREEAVKKSKAEFEEMFKVEDGLRKKRQVGDVFDGRELPVGVRKEGKRFRVRLWHPELERISSFGSYSTYEEAAVVADRIMAELWELYWGKPRSNVNNDEFLQDCESEAAVVADRKRAELWELYGGKPRGNVNNAEVLQDWESEAAVVADRKRAELQELYGGKPGGNINIDEVLKDCESEAAGKFECSNEQTSNVMVPAGVRIKDPASYDRIWLGSYDTAEKAIRRYNREKAMLDTKMKRANCEVVDVFDKLEYEFVHGSRTSNIELWTSDSACVSDFDESVSAGFITEFGQLVGEYGEFDEQMGLALPDENFAASG